MEGFIYRSLMAGLGALSLTREKAEAFVDELVKRGEVAAPQKPKIVQDLLERAQKEEKDILEKIGRVVSRVLADMDLPTKADLQRLEQKIDDLQKSVKAAKK